MKKIIALIMSFLIVFSSNISTKAYASGNDVQAGWLTTVHNIDWPSGKSLTIQQQKAEMIKILDMYKNIGINTVIFQVRPKSDALYKSNINPWSDVLTGTQGKDPGYDPLQFVIEESKKRNMKVHAWLNPYRITTTGTDLNALDVNHPARKNPSWVLQHKTSIPDKDALAYNPGLPEVRKYINDTVAEIVTNYDVDGIHFDDYFYTTGMNDDATYAQYGNGMDKGDWRRENVNTLLKDVKRTIKSIDSSVEFGVSPSGVWKNKSSDPKGSATKGAKESYYTDYADTVKWIEEGYIDYVTPQVYWEMSHKVAPYKVVTEWWANIVKGTNVDLYIGHQTDKAVVAKEIDQQMLFNNNYSTIKGDAYYNTKSLMQNIEGCQDKIKSVNNETKTLDDIVGHWAQKDIMDFIDKGYVGGYEDGTFRPNNSITRAEYVKILNKVFGLTNTSGKVFSDTKGHWAQNEIDIAVTNGVCSGKSATEFKPNDSITREEAATMIANYKGLADDSIDKLTKYNDSNKVSSWAKSSVEGILEKGYMGGYDDNTFRPQSKITRAEAVATLGRIK